MRAEAATSEPELPGEQPGLVTGLRRDALSSWEVLAQSLSTIAPSTTPTLTIPLVAALAGSGSWLAYVLALLGVMLIALCVARFAQDSASAGSLYSYVYSTLPGGVSAVAAWALLFAYVTTASSVTGGFLSYAYVLLGRAGQHVPAVALTVLVALVAAWTAAQDVKISSELMLWIEVISVVLIAAVLFVVMWRMGFVVDWDQLRLRGASSSGVRLGVMLALFSFVGFESATSMGEEAQRPLQTIPRAVIRSALLTGGFFVVCAYTEVLGFKGSGHVLGESTAPLADMAARFGLPFVGSLIDVGVLVSMFACVLACMTAGSRMLLLMAHHGLVPRGLTRVHSRHRTPVVAVGVFGAAALAPAALLALRGISGADMYGWMGTLAVFGFLTAYGLVALALPVYLRRLGRLTSGATLLAGAAVVVMVLFLVGTVFPVPPAPVRYFPYLYAAYLLCGMGVYWMRRPIVLGEPGAR